MITFDALYDQVRGKKKVISVALPYGDEVTHALEDARKEKIAESILVGDKKKIEVSFKELGIDIKPYEIIDIADEREAALKSVELVSSGKADSVMKGKIATAGFLKAVLDEKVGLRTASLLSHIAVIESKKMNKTYIFTDSGMNISPTIDEKVQIINNGIEFAKKMGIAKPKVALVSAVEVVNPKMQSTIDAAIIAKMAQRGQIKGAFVDGPFGFDNAISKEAAEIKGIDSPVAGDADMIIVPDIVSGNLMCKAIMYMAECRFAGIVAGGKKPVILLSRADDAATKLNSIVLGLL